MTHENRTILMTGANIAGVQRELGLRLSTLREWAGRTLAG